MDEIRNCLLRLRERRKKQYRIYLQFRRNKNTITKQKEYLNVENNQNIQTTKSN